MTARRKSQQQLAAEARVRGLLKERDSLGTAAFERLMLKRQAARIERCRERTRAAVLARHSRTTDPDTLPFGEDVA